MLKKLCLLAVGSYSLLVAHGTCADAKADARRQIQAAYDQYASAVARGDIGAIMRVQAPGYSSVDINGQVTRRSDAQERRHYVQLTAPPNKILNTIRILSLDLHGDQAAVTDEEHVEGVRLDKATGQLIPLHIVESDRDFWVKANGHWQRKRSRTLTLVGE